MSDTSALPVITLHAGPLSAEEMLFRVAGELRACEDRCRALDRALADALEVGRVAQSNLTALSTEVAAAALARERDDASDGARS